MHPEGYVALALCKLIILRNDDDDDDNDDDNVHENNNVGHDKYLHV